MYRNGFGSRTQTQTQTPHSSQNNFTGSYNTCGTSTIQVKNSETDDEIIFAVVTGNIITVRRLVNSTNVNKIIDKKNNYTALHHAVRIKKNDQIVEYLLSCGANPNLKQDEGKDAVDLTIESNYRYLIDKMLKDKDNEIDNLYTKFDNVNYKVKELERTNQELTKTNEYLSKSSGQYVTKIDELKTENSNLKRKLDDSEKAFSNLLKKTKK